MSKKRIGYTRDELVEESEISNGGGLTRRLEELEQCGFIRRYQPLNERKAMYQLVDFFCIFYYMFLQGGSKYDRAVWMHMQGTPRYNNWLGLSFERLCFAHVYQIQRALGISGVATKTYSYVTSTAQMDMVIERADKVVSLCEMKCTSKPYALTKQEAEKLGKREEKILELLPTHRQVMISLVSNKLVKRNAYYNELITSNLALKDLFAD